MELDLTSFGLDGVLFQLKYLDLPSKGAKVHMNLRGAISMIRNVCAKFNVLCDLPDDLEVDLIFDISNSRISYKSKHGVGIEYGGWYGETEIESTVEEGVYILKFDHGRMEMRPELEVILKWPLLNWKNGEKTTEVRASIKGGPSCDLSGSPTHLHPFPKVRRGPCLPVTWMSERSSPARGQEVTSENQF